MLHIVTPLDPARQQHFPATVASVRDLHRQTDVSWWIGVDSKQDLRSTTAAVSDIQQQTTDIAAVTVAPVLGGAAALVRQAILDMVQPVAAMDDWILFAVHPNNLMFRRECLDMLHYPTGLQYNEDLLWVLLLATELFVMKQMAASFREQMNADSRLQ